MLTIRKSDERGRGQTDWLDSFHTFSFADYYDPQYMHFGDLRVINEDTIQPAMGFGSHPHRDMEIITYVVEGSLAHRDSMKNGSIIKPGEIQRMSAGTGITHSEYNHSKTDPLHLLQIWIIPDQMGLEPSYEQKTIVKKSNQLILIGSKNGGDGAVTIHQDVDLYTAYLLRHASIKHTLVSGHAAWVQLIKGKIAVNGQVLSAGDGVAITDETAVEIISHSDAELLLFDLGE